MDVKLPDGTIVQNVPDGMTQAELMARVQRMPARMNPHLAAQGEESAENMTPPESVMDPRMPAYRNAQQGANTMDVIGGLGGGVVGGLLKPGAQAMRGGAEWLMRSALKPNPAGGLAKGDRAVRTMLDEGANVTRGGIEKLRGRGTGLNDEVQNILNQSTATIPKGAPATRVQDQIAHVEDVNPLPSAQRAGLEGVQNEYLSNPLVPQQMPLSKAQRYKQGLYQGLKDDYGKMSFGDEAGRKALARGLREEIEQRAPEVAPLNARAADIWNALNVAERRAAVAGNKDPGGLASLAANPVGTGTFLATRSELLKSLLARGLNNSQRIPGAVGGGLAGYYMGQDQ